MTLNTPISRFKENDTHLEKTMTKVLGLLTVAALCIMCTDVLFAQDKSYSTDALKVLKKITPDEWKSLQEKSAARNQQFKDVNAAENAAWAEKGFTVLKANQTLNLTAEVNALFDYIASSGQDNKGTTTTRKRTTFKLGPGNFEVKDGVIRRLN